jgi:hypothetical protein
MTEDTAMPEKDTKDGIELVEAKDLLLLENSGLKAEIYRLQTEVAQLRMSLHKQEDMAIQQQLKEKYSLGVNDKIDPSTLQIIRGQ